MSKCEVCGDKAIGQSEGILFCGQDCQSVHLLGVKYRPVLGLLEEDIKSSYPFQFVFRADVEGARFRIIEKKLEGKIKTYVNRKKRIVYFWWPTQNTTYRNLQKRMKKVYNDIQAGILKFEEKKKKKPKTRREKKKEKEQRMPETLEDILESVSPEEKLKIDTYVEKEYGRGKRHIEELKRLQETEEFEDYETAIHEATMDLMIVWYQSYDTEVQELLKTLSTEGVIYFVYHTEDYLKEVWDESFYTYISRIFWSHVFYVVGYDPERDDELFEKDRNIVEGAKFLKLWFTIKPKTEDNVVKAMFRMRELWPKWKYFESPAESEDDINPIYVKFYTERDEDGYYTEPNVFPNFLKKYLDDLENNTLPPSGWYCMTNNPNDPCIAPPPLKLEGPKKAVPTPMGRGGKGLGKGGRV